MNIIALDTVTPVLSVAAKGRGGTACLTLTDGGQHAPKLLELLTEACSLAGFSPDQTDVIAVPEGPGSFTGLRLAWSSAKALQLASECRLVPVPLLSCYALPFFSWNGALVSVLDAKKNRFYVQIFRKGKPVHATEDIECGEIVERLDPEERILITGPDAELLCQNMTLPQSLHPILCIPTRPQGVAELMVQFADNIKSEYTDNITDYSGPLYVRKSDAETNYSGNGKTNT